MIVEFLDWMLDKLGFEDEDEEFDLGFGKIDGDEVESIQEVLTKQTVFRRDIDVHNPFEREKYVRYICDQMAVLSDDVEEKKREYQSIADRLSDIEEIEALPSNAKKDIRKAAEALCELEENESGYKRPSSKISETKFREIQYIEDELPEVMKTIEENERYQAVCKRDLNLLEGEKATLAYKRKEEKNKMANSKAIFIISAFTAVLAYGVLYALAITMRTDIKFASIVVTAIVAIVMTVVFVNYRDAFSSIDKINKQLNRAIVLQNKAKIKYVNVTNLIDYHYAKYNINSSHELYYLWEKYNEEKEARYHSEHSRERIEESRDALYSILRRYNLKDPSSLIYSPEVLVYADLLAEKRRDLVVQRQRLRKSIDFDSYNLENSKKDIEDLIAKYPQYSKEVLEIVNNIGNY